jgi:hypothetical protein
MDSLRAFYGPKHTETQVLNPPPRVSETNEFFNPVVAHRWAGYFPLIDQEKQVVLDLEPSPNVVFQHPPPFAYFPEHSNISVNLVD